MANVFELIGLQIQTPGAPACVIWGAAGGGKTSRLAQLAETFKAHFEPVIASVRTPDDFGGIPVPDLERGELRRLPDQWVRRVQNADAEGGAIVFFDEISCAPPAVQSPLLRVIQEGVVGDESLGEHVRMVAAANPPEIAAGGWDLAAPLANRFAHFKYDAPDVTEWCDWLQSQESGDEFTVVDPDDWDAAWPLARAIVAGFHRATYGQYLSEDLSKIEGRFPMSYATPRTWEYAARLLATCIAIGGDEGAAVEGELLESVLGPAVTPVFLAWKDEQDLPDLWDLLDGKIKFEHDAARPDRTYVVLTGACQLAMDDTKRYRGAWKLLKAARDSGVGDDMLASAGKILCDYSRRPKNVADIPEAIELSQAMRGILQDAGVM